MAATRGQTTVVGREKRALGDADRTRRGITPAALVWLSEDAVSRRVPLLMGGPCLLLAVGYLTVHLVMLGPFVLLAVVFIGHGVLGGNRGQP